MKQIYNVQRMTYNDYCNYMGGGYNYNVENLHLEAESPEEAVKMAEAEGYMVNKDYVKTVAELEAEEAERKAQYIREEAERKAKAERAKARKAEREAAAAAALGLSLEAYKAKVKRDKKIKTLTAELEAAKREVARLEKALAEA